MATRQHLEFVLGAVWTLPFQCEDATGAALNLADPACDLKVRVYSFDRKTLLLDLSKANGVAFTNAAAGQATAMVTAAMQTAAQIAAGPLLYDAQAVLADGTPVDQAGGLIYVAVSGFADFP